MNNWKEDVKQTLEQREIKPSKDSWNQLEAMLNQQETPSKSNRKWVWGSVAASLIILLSIGTFFMLSDNQDQQTLAKKANVQEINNSNEVLGLNTQQENMKDEFDGENLLNKEKTNLVINGKSSTSENLTEQNNINHTTPLNLDSTNLVATSPAINIDSTTAIKTQSAEDYLAAAMKRLKEDSLNESTLYVSDKTLLNQVEDEVFEEKSPDLLNRITNQIKELQAAISTRNKEK